MCRIMRSYDPMLLNTYNDIIYTIAQILHDAHALISHATPTGLYFWIDEFLVQIQFQATINLRSIYFKKKIANLDLFV
jgi:hypothetical protein